MRDDRVVGIDTRRLPELDEGHEHAAGNVPGVGELSGDAFGLILLVEGHHGVGDGRAGSREGVYRASRDERNNCGSLRVRGTYQHR